MEGLWPYISSRSHHPNPTQTERIYRAFLSAYAEDHRLSLWMNAYPVVILFYIVTF
jgi:hypothetical protein